MCPSVTGCSPYFGAEPLGSAAAAVVSSGSVLHCWLGNSCQPVVARGGCCVSVWAQRGRWRTLNVCRRRFVRRNLRLCRRMGNICIRIATYAKASNSPDISRTLFSLSYFSLNSWFIHLMIKMIVWAHKAADQTWIFDLDSAISSLCHISEEFSSDWSKWMNYY